MEQGQVQRVSVIDPIGTAVDWVKRVLFSPFGLGRWCTIGFCAFLAYLGSGGFSFNYRTGRGDFEQAKEFVLEHLALVAVGAAVGVAAIIALWLLFCWLSSRGRFMFLHCVAKNVAEVKAPWAKYKTQGNSLFAFRAVLVLVGLAVVLAIVAVPVLLIVGLCAVYGRPARFEMILIAAPFVGVLFIAAMALGIVALFTEDFIVPIMYLRTIRCAAAWREFLRLFSANKLRFIGYYLFQILIVIALGLIVAMICLVGCCFCCANILLMVPYIGTVILLPIFVFRRAYSLFYLRQYGTALDVFVPEQIIANSPQQ